MKVWQKLVIADYSSERLGDIWRPSSCNASQLLPFLVYSF